MKVKVRCYVHGEASQLEIDGKWMANIWMEIISPQYIPGRSRRIQSRPDPAQHGPTIIDYLLGYAFEREEKYKLM